MGCNAVQVSRRVLYVNVTATLGVNVPPNASPDDVRSALDVTNLSADDPIAMLAANPDKFFGRTTKVGLAAKQAIEKHGICHAMLDKPP